MKKYILGVLVTLLSCSTNNQSKEIDGDEMITVNINDQTVKPLPYDSIFSDIQYVKLKSTGKNLLGEINQLYFSDSLIFVIDNRITNAINIYDYNGNLENRICNIGSGPKEYVNMNYVTMDEENKFLVVTENPRKRLLYYSFKGEFSHAEKIPFYYSEMEFSGSNRFFNTYMFFDSEFDDHRSNSLIVTDDKSNIEYSFYKSIYSEYFTFSKHRILKKFDGKIYFTPNICDTIFEIKNDGVKAKYHIKIDDKDNATTKQYKTTDDFFEIIKENIYFNGNFMEFENSLLFIISSPAGFLQFIYYKDKKDEVNMCYHTNNHPLYGLINLAPIERFNNNCIVYIIQAYQLISLKDVLYIQYPQYNSYLDELYDGLTEDSDPLLVFCYLK